jgi:peptidoglycan hydrolase CwlO-like protein
MKRILFLTIFVALMVFAGCNKKSEPATDIETESTKTDSLSEKDTLSLNDFVDTTKFKKSVEDVKKKIDEKQKELNKEMDEVKKKLDELEK